MRPLVYNIESRKVADVGFRPHAVVTCPDCGEPGAVPAFKNHNPEDIAKKFRALGWNFDAWSRSVVRCPQCKAARGELRAAASTVRGNNGGVVLDMNKHMARPAAAQARVAEATPADRKRIRDFLAGVFDEEKGIYLDAYTDKRVGEELKLAEVVVREIRETAFGPLKSVPELDEVRAKLADLDKRGQQLAADLAKWAGEITEARKQLDTAQQRLGLAA